MFDVNFNQHGNGNESNMNEFQYSDILGDLDNLGPGPTPAPARGRRHTGPRGDPGEPARVAVAPGMVWYEVVWQHTYRRAVSM